MSAVSADRDEHAERIRSSATTDEVISFGPFRLFVARRLIEREGVPLQLGSRALDILIVLVKEAGTVVSKGQLIARAWSGITVDEANIRVQVAALRRALDDGKAGARYVTSLPGQGYCFVAPISRLGGLESADKSIVRSHNLPPRLMRIVGRDETINEIIFRVKTERFVTIVGPGGIGKTTVAISAGHRLRDEFAGAIYFFDLGLLNDPLLVPGTIALTLGIPPHSADPAAGLISYLRDKRALLIVDSCEHVIGAAAALAERIFEDAPQVHILTTSRESLRAEGEHLHWLPPLDSPPKDAGLTASQSLGFPAVQLFVERAIAAGRRFEEDDADMAAIGEICRRLDGIALAIQLAAARSDAYGIEGILSLLNDRLGLIWEGRRTASPRHQTLGAALDWSYDLLSEQECQVLSGLSVFVGNFTLDAACAVAADEDVDEIQVVTAAASLVRKSLVEVDTDGSTTRYKLLDTTRAYAAVKLTQSRKADVVKRRHAVYYRDLFERHDVDSLALSRDTGLRTELLGNARTALDWSLASQDHTAVGVSLAALVAPFLSELSLLAECRRLTERALGVLGNVDRGTRQEMELQASLGSSLMLTGGYRETARIALTRALDLAEALHDSYFRMRMLRGLHNFHMAIGEVGKAVEMARRNEAVAKATGDPAPIAVANWLLGVSNYFVGNQLAAETSCEALVAHPGALRIRSKYFGFDSHTETRLRCALAAIRWLRGFPDQAAKMAREVIERQGDAEHPATLSISLVFSGFMFVRIGDVPLARTVIDRLISHSETHSIGPQRDVGLALKGALAIHHGNPEEGVELMRVALDMLQAGRHELHHPALLGSLAEGLAKNGQIDSALAAVESAIARVDANGQAFTLPELLRIKGTILMRTRPTDLSLAEELFQRSLKLAVTQHAQSWELRTARSFAEFRSMQGRQIEARNILAPVFDRFTEGFESSDLKGAKSFLDELTTNPG